MSNIIFPYANSPVSEWPAITERLVSEHPLKSKEIVEIVLASWSSIFESSIGVHGFKIGQNIFPKPQIMGFFLHELIALEIAARYPDEWRGEINSSDKDIVYLKKNLYSIEIKTSSNPKHIFGNRSYAQESLTGKKSKSGYYLAVNFESLTLTNTRPVILVIRFGWLDHTDWIAQKSPTGQQARLGLEIYTGKFKTLYSHS